MIVFSDLDGTFLTPARELSARTRAALDALAREGVDFVPCTGRPLRGISREILRHPAVRFAVSANGATVSELAPGDPAPERARTIHSAALDRGTALAIWEIARSHDVTFDIFGDGTCYLRRDLMERIPEFARDPVLARTMVSTRVAVDEEPPETIARVGTLERVSMYWLDPRDRDAILDALKGIPGIGVTRSYPINIEVMDASASKGSALAWLCDHLGIPCGEAIAFGDNINDIPMIEAAGTGVAVANAEAEMRAAADAVCASNAEDGPATFILERLAALPRG